VAEEEVVDEGTVDGAVDVDVDGEAAGGIAAAGVVAYVGCAEVGSVVAVTAGEENADVADVVKSDVDVGCTERRSDDSADGAAA